MNQISEKLEKYLEKVNENTTGKAFDYTEPDKAHKYVKAQLKKGKHVYHYTGYEGDSYVIHSVDHPDELKKAHEKSPFAQYDKFHPSKFTKLTHENAKKHFESAEGTSSD